MNTQFRASFHWVLWLFYFFSCMGKHTQPNGPHLHSFQTVIADTGEDRFKEEPRKNFIYFLVHLRSEYFPEFVSQRYWINWKVLFWRSNRLYLNSCNINILFSAFTCGDSGLQSTRDGSFIAQYFNRSMPNSWAFARAGTWRKRCLKLDHMPNDWCDCLIA